MEKKTHVIIASIILSFFVWLSVSMNEEYTIVLRVPFVVKNLPDGMALASEVPKTIVVRLRGTGWQIASAYFSPSTQIEADLSNVESQKLIFTSREFGYSLNIGSNVQILSYNPDTVVLAIDSISQRVVPIVSRVVVQPRQGFMTVGPQQIVPDSVTISGARRLISSIRAWPTAFRLIKNADRTKETIVPLLDSLSNIVSFSTDEVKVVTDVQQIVENQYSGIPVKISGLTDSSQIMLLPPVINVTLRGGIKTIADLTNDSIHAFVDYSVLKNLGTNKFVPDIIVPQNTQIIKIQPDSVEFIFRK
ncbi:MAG: CdaR family protein [Candidatus Kryptoniota bacterium]